MIRCNGRGRRAVVAAVMAISGGLANSARAQTIQRLLGVDVSDWQEENPTHTPIDWELAHRPVSQGGGGKDFVFMRSSRGGTNGTYNKFTRVGTGSHRYDDYAFERNMTGAIAAGMYASPYHFLRADIVTYTHPVTGVLTTHTGADEANHFLEMAGHYMRPGYLLPVMDLESGNTQRSPDNLAAFAVKFGQTIYDATGFWPMVYASTSYASDPDTSGNAAGYIRSIVAEKMPNLWLARWPNQANPDAIDVQNIDPTPANGYPNAYGVWNPDYPNTPDPHPWKFWQYASTGKNIPGILGDANGNTDLNVAHGGHEFVKDYLVPALWTKTIGGDWATIANWNTDAHVSGLGPTARLPGGDDTIVLDRPNENVFVTVNSAVPSIRKLYLRENLRIGAGGALAVTYVPSPDSTPMSVHLFGNAGNSLQLADGAAFSAHTIYVDAGAFMDVSAANFTFDTLRLSSGNVVNIIDAFEESQSPTFAGFNGGTATITHNAAPGQSKPFIYLMGGGGGFNVLDGAAEIDLAVNIPITNGTLRKHGAGTMALGALNTLNQVVIQRGILLVTGANQLGSGPVSTQQTVVTPFVSGYGGTLQLSGNVSYNRPLSIAGGGALGVSNIGSGNVGALDNLSGDNTWAGPITLMGTGANGTDPLINQIGSRAGALTLSGVISDNGAAVNTWAKSGDGDVVLAGESPNTYHGLTRLYGGRLIIEKDGALGSAGEMATATGNTFQLAGSASTFAFRNPAGASGFTYGTFEVINTHGSGAPGFAQVDNLGGDNTFAGQIAIGGPTSGGTTQTGSIGVTDGTLTLTGGIYARGSGPRIINKPGGGTLVLAGDGGLATGNPNVTPLASSTFNVTAGAVALTGTPSNGANLPGVTRWNVTGGSTLQIHQGGALGTAVVNLDGGALRAAETLTAPNPILIGPADAAIDSAGNDVTLTGGVSGAAALAKNGAGTATLTGDVSGVAGGPLAVNAGTLAIGSNGTPFGMMHVSSLVIAGGARLDLADNDILVNYSGSSPYATLRDYVVSGGLNGTGIVSSTSTGDTVLALGESADYGLEHDGVSIDDTTIIGKYTYFGDANLDGMVTSDDYVAVDVGIGVGTEWMHGDFDFDGAVTSDDYVAIDVNLGKGASDPLAFAELKTEMIALHAAMFGDEYLARIALAEAEGFATFVPEPAGFAGLALAALALRRRRRA